MENPYTKLLDAFKQPRPPAGLAMGRVDSWPDAAHPDRPHLVTVDGLQRGRESLRADTRLMPYTLAAGDLLLLAPTDEGQRFIILCRVVDV